MKCKECNLKEFDKRKGQPGRWYCKHKDSRAAFSSSGCAPALICRTDRHSDKLTIKTAPRWCPLKIIKKKTDKPRGDSGENECAEIRHDKERYTVVVPVTGMELDFSQRRTYDIGLPYVYIALHEPGECCMLLRTLSKDEERENSSVRKEVELKDCNTGIDRTMILVTSDLKSLEQADSLVERYKDTSMLE